MAEGEEKKAVIAARETGEFCCYSLLLILNNFLYCH